MEFQHVFVGLIVFCNTSSNFSLHPVKLNFLLGYAAVEMIHEQTGFVENDVKTFWLNIMRVLGSYMETH